MDVQAIFTAPPYANFLAKAAAHPIVSGLRLNTVMPLREGPREALERLSGLGKPLWVDLKGRQLRVEGAAIPPFTEVMLSHEIEVETPVDAFFSDGTEHARVVAVEGRRLILEDGPRRLIGPGESVNIVHPSLKIHGVLTETDQTYLHAMKEFGLNRVMLSFVEGPEDIEAVKAILPDAEIVQKIESNKGLEYTKQHGAKHGRLMAARGDLYVEVLEPHKIIGALRMVISTDPEAIAASRIFDSLAFHPVPASADIGDLAFLLSLGYRTFLLGDAICLREDTLTEALNLLQAVAEEFTPPPRKYTE